MHRFESRSASEGVVAGRTGASMLALGIAMLATPAAAQQVVVGSVQCPIVDGTGTCEGDLSGGVTSQQAASHPPVRTIVVRNPTAPIAPPTGIFGIGADRSDGDLTISVANGVVIDVFDNQAIPEPAQGIVGLLRGGRALTIDSGATITSNGAGRGAGGPGAGIEGDAFGAGGSVTIVNSGRITANSTTHRSTAIAGQLFAGAGGDIRITNSGALFASSTAAGERDNVVAGIVATDTGAAASGAQIVVTNSGAITVRTGAVSFDTDFVGIASGIVTNALTTNSNTIITNSGAIDSQGSSAQGITAFSRGSALAGDTSILIDNSGTVRLDGTGNALFAQTAGEKVDATIRNAAAGAITVLNANAANLGTSGIQLLSQARTGTLTIDNDAAIATAGTAYSRGIGLVTNGAPANGNYTMLLDNGGAITIGSTLGQGLQIGASRDDTATATLVNTGVIDLRATTNAQSGGVIVNLGQAGTGDGVTSATIANSGAITVGAGVGLYAGADTITVTNSGTIATAGAFSDAVDLIGTGTGAIAFTTTGSISAAGANSDAIAVYGTAASATLNLNGVTVSAPTGIANSENYAIRVAGDIATTLNLTNAARVTGDLVFAGGADRITLTAGNRVTGNLALGAGNDAIVLATGTFDGAIDLGAGDDQIDINQFSLTDVAAIDSIEGGAGNDVLNFRLADGAAITLPTGTLQITNVETFAQSGAATVTLTGTNAAFNSTYELRQGNLNQNAVLATTNLTTSVGTVAAVSGTVRNLSVAGGILPGGGGAVGTASVGGNVVLASTGRYIVDILAGGTSDLIAATGSATLSGTLSVNALSPADAFGASTSYTILTAAGGVTGTFASTINEDLPLLNLTLAYSANAVRLTAARAAIAATGIAQTYNQRQVAGVIDATQTTATGDYATVVNALVFSTTPQALAAFDTGSGELHASILAAGLRQSRAIGNAMQARIQAMPGRDVPAGFALWLAGGAIDASIDGDGNAARVSGDSRGLTLGGEYTGSGYGLGAAVGYARTDVDVSGRASSADIDGWQAGVYGRAGTGGAGFTLSAAGAYAEGDADTRRGVVVNTIARTATARYKVETYTVGGAVRYGVPIGGSAWSAGPVATIDHAHVRRGRFAEQGAGSLDLSGGSDSDDLTAYGVGGFVNRQDARGRIDLGVLYETGSGDVTATRLALEGAPGAPFLVRSPATDRGAMRIGLAGALSLGNNWSLGAAYRGRIADGADDHGGLLSLIWRQ